MSATEEAQSIIVNASADPGADAATPASDSFADKSYVGSRYATYVLVVLTIVYVLNFVDRQIISILADDIKADLRVTDADLGILYGTVFAVFYALFGIPLGRLADVWMRRSMIYVGLAFWSVMTTLSGTATAFGGLLGYRIGVGVGEASATPAAQSMLSDYFSPRRRATVMAIYASGVYIGGGVGLAIGGIVLGAWHHWFPDPTAAPFGLKGWHVAFMLVGLPGVLLALWVRTLREPIRGMSEGFQCRHEPHPFRVFGRETMGVMPVLSFVNLIISKASGKVLAVNILVLIAVIAGAWGLTLWLHNPVQWIAMAFGVYCTFTWTQALIIRSPEVFDAIFKNRTVVLLSLSFPCSSFVGYGSNFFVIPYLLRAHHVSEAQVGTVIGLTAAVAALIGVTVGGMVADTLRRKWAHGRLLVGLFCSIVAVPFAAGVYFSSSMTSVYIFNFFAMFFSPMFIGPAFSTLHDLVPPHVRGTASAVCTMMVTFIGLAMGPFTMGQISTAYAKSGMAAAPALRTGVAWGYLMLIAAIILLVMACFTIGPDTRRLREAAKNTSAPA